MNAPLLELRAVQVERDGRRVLDAVNLVTSGERIGLLGEGRHIIAAFCGEATIASGSLLLCGVELEEARKTHLFGIARPWSNPANVTYPFTVFEGLVLSAMLAGYTEAESRKRTEFALSLLGLAHFGRHRLGKRVGLDHHLAGLVEAALFEPTVIVVDWPLGDLTADGWARYGTALSRLVSRRRWLTWVSGPARLPVEQAWVGALDQLFLLDGELSIGIVPGLTNTARTLLVLGVEASQVEPFFDTLGIKPEPVGLVATAGEAKSAYVLDLPTDEFGRVMTSTVLEWSDEHQLPIVRLEVIS
jgi:predicted ABC-type transport system involved in lysophospholipase L1 biosynthesis ATPase subunit